MVTKLNSESTYISGGDKKDRTKQPIADRKSSLCNWAFVKDSFLKCLGVNSTCRSSKESSKNKGNKIFPTSQNKAKAINGEETGEIRKQNGIGKEEILTSPIDIENQENVENQPSGRNGIGMQSKETHKLNNNLAQDLGVHSPPQQRKCCNVSVNLSQRTFAPQYLIAVNYSLHILTHC
ncbi:hypothetical protein EB796_018538 [Bugula neritina]|uniref:Uncharacterized protein n=1 Tax=Bugula neritina TaxID=10212 RepID=A0A7J7JAA1_BUGNE|nr:hypothetical protein EB796_018538 [Bugula neritina]